ncbi:MAG TPA: ABC transporter permease [Ktedonobacterales bacterium]|nr:ABC transporter permease [Ktedonobacterales bacterium]
MSAANKTSTPPPTGAPMPAHRVAAVDEHARVRQVVGWLARYGTLAALAAMILAFSALAPGSFPTLSNFVNIVNQASLTAIISVGLTVPLIVGEFDLSIGYLASLAGVFVTGFMVNQHFPILIAILAVLAVGALVGLVNGLLVTKAGVNAVIATLGTGTVLIGLNYGYSAGIPVAVGVPDAFLRIAFGSILGIPNDIIIMAVVVAVLWVLLNRTDAGQRIQAVGGNTEAARLSGIRVDRVKIAAFMIASVCAALTGILLASLIGSGSTTAGDGYLLDAFAAVFLGSVTLRDGEFHILGTLVGVLIIGVAYNGLAIFGAPTFGQYVVKGSILVIAVALSTVARRFARGS